MSSFKILGRKKEQEFREFLSQSPSSLDQDGLDKAQYFSNIDPNYVAEGDSLHDVYNQIMGNTSLVRKLDENGNPVYSVDPENPNRFSYEYESVDYSSIGRPDQFPSDNNIFDAAIKNPEKISIQGKMKPTQSDQVIHGVISFEGDEWDSEDKILKAKEIAIRTLTKLNKVIVKPQSNTAAGQTTYLYDGQFAALFSKLHKQDSEAFHMHFFLHKRVINNSILESYKVKEKDENGKEVEVLKTRPKTREVDVFDEDTGKTYKKPVVDKRREITAALDLTKDAIFQDLFKEYNAALVAEGLPPIDRYLKYGETRNEERREATELVQSTDTTKLIENKIEESTKKSEIDVKELTEEDVLKSDVNEVLNQNEDAKLKSVHKTLNKFLAEKYEEIHVLSQMRDITEESMQKTANLTKTTEVLKSKLEELAALEEEKAKVDEELLKESQKNESLVEQVVARNLTIESNEEEIKSLKTELEEANNNYDELSEILEAESNKYKELETKHITLEESHNKLNDEFTALNEKYLETDAKLEQTENVLDDTKIKLADSEKIVAEKEIEISLLNEAIKNQEDVIAEKDELIDGFKAEIESLSSTVLEQGLTIESLTERLTNSEDAKRVVDELLEQAKNDLEEIQVRYGMEVDKNVELDNKYNALADENKSVIDANEKLQKENNRLEEEKSKFEVHINKVADEFNFSPEEKDDFSGSLINEVHSLNDNYTDQKKLLDYIANKHGIDLEKSFKEMQNGKPKNKGPKPE
ncbi:hypothetical protein E1N66_10400 [Pantoea allii]|nr:hypothetical protein [Pantoea allii]THB84434.1 hypothetical protein E1N66_10400 [Pantoea allii]